MAVILASYVGCMPERYYIVSEGLSLGGRCIRLAKAERILLIVSSERGEVPYRPRRQPLRFRLVNASKVLMRPSISADTDANSSAS